jgi:hypothetical protein
MSENHSIALQETQQLLGEDLQNTRKVHSPLYLFYACQTHASLFVKSPLNRLFLLHMCDVSFFRLRSVKDIKLALVMQNKWTSCIIVQTKVTICLFQINLRHLVLTL